MDISTWSTRRGLVAPTSVRPIAAPPAGYGERELQHGQPDPFRTATVHTLAAFEQHPFRTTTEEPR